MATLDEIYNRIFGGILGTSAETKFSDDVAQALGPPTRPETPITDLSKVSKRPPSSPGAQTGSRAIVRMPSSGEVRRGKTLDQGPPTSPQGAAYGLKPGTPLTIEQMEQLRAKNLEGDTRFKTKLDELPRGTAAMGEFAGATMPNLLRPDFREIDVATRPINPVRAPGEGFNQFEQMEELDANNLALANLMIQDSPYTAPKAALGAGLMDGADQAEYNNQKREQKGLLDSLSEGMGGLLGNDTVQAFLQVLARPEFVAPMGPGQSPVTNFVNAAAADRTARAAQRKAAGESTLEQFKAETDRLKAQQIDPSKLPKLTSEVNKMYDRIESSRRISSIGTKIKQAFVDSPFITGGPGQIAQAFRGMAAAFGIDPGQFKTDDVQKNVAKLKGEVLKSKTFGREASRQELEQILNKILADPGLLTSSTQILDSVDSMMRDAERDIFNTTARMKVFGLPISTDSSPMSMPERYFKRNNQRAN